MSGLAEVAKAQSPRTRHSNAIIAIGGVRPVKLDSQRLRNAPSRFILCGQALGTCGAHVVLLGTPHVSVHGVWRLSFLLHALCLGHHACIPHLRRKAGAV